MREEYLDKWVDYYKDLEKDVQDSIQQLYSIYSHLYSAETINAFYFNTDNLKR